MAEPHLTVVNPEDFKIIILSDDTTTTAEVVQHGTYRIGRGVARRRKGDRRNPDLGTRLALARAFRDAAEKVEKSLEGFDV